MGDFVNNINNGDLHTQEEQCRVRVIGKVPDDSQTQREKKVAANLQLEKEKSESPTVAPAETSCCATNKQQNVGI